MDFYKIYWKEDHILATSREFFDYQHVYGEKVNYVIGIDENEIIYGVMGFVMLNKTKQPDIVSMMIKTIKNERGMLGYEMGLFVEKELNVRRHMAVGINPKTAGRISLARGCEIDILKQYYRLNDVSGYAIAKIKNKTIPSVQPSEKKLVRINSFREFDALIQEEELAKEFYYKDKFYYRHRYFQHPVYDYHCYLITGCNSNTILVGRKIEVNQRKIFRIVELIGKEENLNGIGMELDRMMCERQYEYIDFLCYGIKDKYLEDAGFIQRKINDVNIIPHYFEPFEQRNIDIWFNKEPNVKMHLYKGDGDQDRPNYCR